MCIRLEGQLHLAICNPLFFFGLPSTLQARTYHVIQYYRESP